ncbi:hypothetical protein K2173_017293 [Erythroxylum novogranatense]|uniref:Late embryogenesis abundant protein LEA-2 subgroup domain-containing protein n=1 Tax=Erythroxylum novogranatense TaxID=1862640 RepID=A0AAV8UEK9_9ROSI|nr:hypothetical protein K2173_017293 [Erythroxylum novogranatense]
MSYPPTMAHPPMQQGYNYYHAYNTNGYGYSYAQAPPASYYHPQYYQSQQIMQQSSNFVRGMLLGFMFLLLFMFSTSMIMWLILRPEFPVFRINNFSVTNFNATPPVIFTANWDANLTVENPNTKLKVDFDRIENFVYDAEDDQLASSFSQPFSLETKTSQVMVATMSANGTSQLEEGSLTVEKLGKERSSGDVTFSVRMVFWTTFKASWWTRHAILKVLCNDMKVPFVGASGNGNLPFMDKGHCLVYA